ncbi:aromatic acid exporter family protein [Microbacterium sp. Se63.02b]|uniref:FUSC family protein n=1 Tax=Microbacterium sp. Se63.02b TaxID=2709304 RepID=UPI001FCEEF17|nr:aromatic acid exporter family protein [Microbacterium sp. Se63.02b]
MKVSPRLEARRSGVARALHEAVLPARLLLVAKTMLAVGLAWAIAPHMPGVTDDYPYYAPLGALVSMYPTLMGSAKSSLQTLLGLAAGIGLATLIVLTVGPTWWSIPLVVGLGVLVSGTGWFGVGREYVPMAALFVLIIGGQNADDYSLGYLTQMAVGVVVGLVVNLLIAPAPLTAVAAARIEAFRARLSAHLHDIGDAVSESWPPEHEQWVDDAASLAETTMSLRTALTDADEQARQSACGGAVPRPATSTTSLRASTGSPTSSETSRTPRPTPSGTDRARWPSTLPCRNRCPQPATRSPR